MKKVLAFVLCLCMALGICAFAVSAETDVFEVKDGAVLEFETYAGEENKDMYVFENPQDGKPAYPYGGVVACEEASAGAYLGLSERNGAGNMTFTIPVNVTESGLYDLEIMGTIGGNGEYLSVYTINVGDGELVAKYETEKGYTPPEGTHEAEGGYTAPDYKFYPMNYVRTRAYIPAGEQNIVVEAQTNTNELTGIGVKMALDYLSFNKVVLPEADLENGIVIEMEDFIPYINYTFDEEGSNSAAKVEEAKASGGAVMDMTERSHVAAIEFDVPFVIKESGWYDLNLVASTSNNSDTSVLSLKDGEDEWINNWVNSGYASKEALYFGEVDTPFRWYSVYDHETSRYIEAGEYNLKASAVSITNQANATKFVADCLKITPVNMELPADGTIELENAKNFFSPWKPGSSVADGDASVTMLHTYGGEDVVAGIPVIFPESGYYDITFLGTPWNNNGLSKIDISIDGTLIMDNDNTKYGNALGYDYKQYLPAYEFTKEFVYIEEGVHNVSVAAFVREPDNPLNECAFGMDSITFVRAEDQVSVNTSEKTLTITAFYGAPTSGSFIAVAYKDNQLVGIVSFDEVDRTIFDAVIPYDCDGTPDTVKVFVWEDLASVAPVVKAKTIAVK